MNIQTNAWVFQDTTITGNGNVFKSGRNDQLTIYITGDSTSREVHIEGCDSDDNWYSVPALKLPEMTIASVVTENNTVYSINLANYVGIRCRVSAVSGGTLKITGRVVDVGASLITNIPTNLNATITAPIQTALLHGTSTEDGTTGTLIDSTKNFELGSLNGKTIKFSIGDTEYTRTINGSALNQLDFSDTDIGTSAIAIIGSGFKGEGQVTISVGEGTGANYTVQFTEGTGFNSGAIANYNISSGLLTIISPTDENGNPIGIMPGNLQSVINANGNASGIFTVTTVVGGLGLPIRTDILSFTNDEMTVGSGTPAEGQVIVQCHGELMGTVGNDYFIEIVQGEALTGDDIATLDTTTKTLTITVNLTAGGEIRPIGSGTLQTLLANTVGIADKFFIDNDFVPNELPIGGGVIQFAGGTNEVPVVSGVDYVVF